MLKKHLCKHKKLRNNGWSNEKRKEKKEILDVLFFIELNIDSIGSMHVAMRTAKVTTFHNQPHVKPHLSFRAFIYVMSPSLLTHNIVYSFSIQRGRKMRGVHSFLDIFIVTRLYFIHHASAN